MKKILILILVTLLVFAGCSSDEVNDSSNQNQIDIPKSDSVVDNTQVNIPQIPECESGFIKSENTCCEDTNQNNFCDDIDKLNELKLEYDSISSEITGKEFVKIIATGTEDNLIDQTDKIKIYYKLANNSKDVNVEKIILKLQHVGGGATYYYNTTYGPETYTITYISNEGMPFKENYLTSKDVILISFNPDSKIKTAQSIYIKLFTNSGFFTSMSFNTPKTFTTSQTKLYP